jgi:hypothetical protein
MKSPLHSPAIARFVSLLAAIAIWYVIRQHLAQPSTPAPGALPAKGTAESFSPSNVR